MTQEPLYEHSIKMNEGAVKATVMAIATASIDATVQKYMQEAVRGLIHPYVASVIAAQVVELSDKHKALVRAEIERVMPGAIAGAIKVRLPSIVWLECRNLVVEKVVEAVVSMASELDVAAQIADIVDATVSPDGQMTPIKKEAMQQIAKMSAQAKGQPKPKRVKTK
jgi:hypothetical protein